jgi:hypothetical protein
LFSGLTDYLYFLVADVEHSRILSVVDYQSLHQSDASLLSSSPASVPAVVDSEDAALARELIAGKRSAASVAWQRYRPAVQTTLRRLLGPSEDIADLTQDVFARFFDKVEELRSLQALRPFIIGIAFRRAREEIRAVTCGAPCAPWSRTTSPTVRSPGIPPTARPPPAVGRAGTPGRRWQDLRPADDRGPRAGGDLRADQPGPSRRSDRRLAGGVSKADGKRLAAKRRQGPPEVIHPSPSAALDID